MRIITGIARGAKLLAPTGENTRPTAERTKEAVFSMLQYEFAGRRVLDLFGGSGQMGLEALSRGAAEAVIVDRVQAAIDVIQKNAAHTRLADRTVIRRAEALAFLKNYHGAPFHLVFLDPPYATDLLPRTLAALLDGGLLASGAIIVTESGAPEAVFAGDTALEERFTVLRRARYGAAHITLLTPQYSAE